MNYIEPPAGNLWEGTGRLLVDQNVRGQQWDKDSWHWYHPLHARVRTRGKGVRSETHVRWSTEETGSPVKWWTGMLLMIACVMHYCISVIALALKGHFLPFVGDTHLWFNYLNYYYSRNCYDLISLYSSVITIMHLIVSVFPFKL